MRLAHIVLLAASFLGGACVEGSPDVSATRQSVLDGNRIVTNRIVTNRIVTNRIVTNRIVTNAISTNRFTLNQQSVEELLVDADGRELLQVIIGCALPPGITLETDFQGTHFEFFGEIGLAPKWLERGLRLGEKRWMSSCMLSRVNRFGIEVVISIRGPHDALVASEDEAEQFSLEEGAFFGNIFTPLDQPLIMNACRGRSQAKSEPTTGDLANRDCTEPDPAKPGKTFCDFNYAGDCAAFKFPLTPHSCGAFVPHESDHLANHDGDDEHDGGFYLSCRETPGIFALFPLAARTQEVVTVFVQP